MFRVALAIGILISFPLQPLANDEEVPHYIQIRNLSLRILELCPPEFFIYLGIGRSPTPIIRFFQELHPEMAKNIPFSSSSLDLSDVLQYQRDLIVRHLDMHLPPPSWLEKKYLLLIDYTQMGRSLGLALDLITWYAEETKKPYAKRIRPLILHNPNYYAKDKNRLLPLHDYIFPLTDELASAMSKGLYKPFAEFDKFFIELAKPNSPPYVPNLAYDDFGARLRKQMASDWVLENNLKHIMPNHQLVFAPRDQAIPQPTAQIVPEISPKPDSDLKPEPSRALSTLDKIKRWIKSCGD